MTAVVTLPGRAKLIEAALRSSNPAAFLVGMQSAFHHAGRHEEHINEHSGFEVWGIDKHTVRSF